jgi:hypothetical protein
MTTEGRRSDASGTAGVGAIDMKLEVVTDPRFGFDRTKEFYGRLGVEAGPTPRGPPRAGSRSFPTSRPPVRS